MTELNDEHHPGAAQPTHEWPDTTAPTISEPSIAALMGTLDGIEVLPVSEHEAVYSELHDALLRALNEDAPNGEA